MKLEKFFNAGKIISTIIESGKDITDNYLDEERAYIIENYDKELLRKISMENTLRKVYTGKIFVFTCIWVFISLTIIFLNAFNITNLSDKVLIALISTATLNILGFFTLVIKYLFNPKISNIAPK